MKAVDEIVDASRAARKAKACDNLRKMYGPTGYVYPGLYR